MAIAWENAPVGTTHVLESIGYGGIWWIILHKDGTYSYWVGDRYIHDKRNFKEVYFEIGKGKFRTYQKPLEENMAVQVKDIKHTIAYAQLREFVKLVEPEERKRPSALGMLARRLARGVDANKLLNGDEDINTIMSWALTLEGHRFWATIHTNTIKALDLEELGWAGQPLEGFDHNPVDTRPKGKHHVVPVARRHADFFERIMDGAVDRMAKPQKAAEPEQVKPKGAVGWW